MASIYAVGVVQLATAGFLSLYVLGDVFATASKGGSGLPAWLFPLDLVLSVVAVIAMAVAYQRGDLDQYEVRRHRQPRDVSGR